jgi:Holliday junction DNA helicase RuvA
MYAYLNGRIAEKNPANVVLDVNGVGYHVHISLNTFEAIGVREQLKLYTYLSIREDAHVLFGFAEEIERTLFLQLISVSGVGANTARIILSSMTTTEATEAIASGNAALLQRVKGIGAKTAQRIVVDLKDKVGKVLTSDTENSTSGYNTGKEEALSALLVLGFNKVAADKVLTKLMQQDASLSVEKLIKEALKVL